MKSVFRFTLALAVGLLLLAPFAALAQTTGTIEGSVTDQSGAALPGVTVELTSPNLQGMRTAVTAADGRFRFPSLPPGIYTVTGSLSGFGKVQKKATVTLDATTSVALSLSLSTTAEVTVTGEAPLVDSTSSTTGTNYSAAVISKLPVGRNYADIVFSQPGVQSDFGETQGRSLAISIYGATSSENLFLIDGVNTTNVIKGFQGKDINNEFVQEVEVKTGGYQAEYGRNTGGVVNVITKSGGNEFHGGAFGYYNDTAMRALPANGDPANYNTPAFSGQGDEQAAGCCNLDNSIFSKDNRQEWGGDLGGFFVKDKVWFFGAYDRVRIFQNVQALNVNNVRTFGVEFPRDYVQNKYSGKITLNLFQGTSIVGSVFSDSQTQEGTLATPPTGLVPTSYTGRRDTGGPDYGARLNQLFGSVGIFTFQYSQHKDRFATIPGGMGLDASGNLVPGNRLPAIRDYTVTPNGTSFQSAGGLGNIFGPTVNNQSKREQYAGSFTGYIGNMEFKIGGDYSNDDTFGATYFTGGQRLRIRPCLQSGSSICDLTQAPFYTNSLGQTRQVYYQHDLLASGTPSSYSIIPSSPFNTPIKRYSGFVQDQWRIIPALTVNLGVRYDTESYYGLDPITGPFKAFSLTSQWAPRVGLVWDFVGDGTSKLYASAGRFYYAIPTDLTVRVFTANSAIQAFNYSATDINQAPVPQCTGTVQTGCVPRIQLFQGGSASGEPVDPGTKAAYQDELTIGIEKAIDPTLSVGLKGTYRTLGRTVEDRCDLNADIGPTCPNCAPSSCALQNPGSSTPSASGFYPTCNGSGNPTVSYANIPNPDPNSPNCSTATGSGYPLGPARRYFRGIELTARKQFSTQLWTQFSFLYSSLIGNYSGAIREASGQTDPGINADYDYYQFTQKAFGRLELDRPVQARLDAVYTAPFGLTAGLGFYVRSGLPISKLGWFNDFYPDLLYLNTRGSDGRNPTEYEANVTLGYNLNVGPVTITPMVYVFNVLNRQTVQSVDSTFNPQGSFVTDPTSPFYGQAGIQPGSAANCPATATAPCSDNPDYLKANQRSNPRLLRVALKITF
jgi:outer membrane receptor protein involved in Fe transport